MDNKFSFDSAGVRDWQQAVYALGQTGINAECALITTDFKVWMVTRFYLSEDQVNFIEELGPYTQLSYAASIQDALQLQGEITLEKSDPPANFAKVKNPKIVYKEQQNEVKQQSPSSKGSLDSDETVQTVKLHFRIAYVDVE